MQSYVQLHKLYKYCKKAIHTKLSLELLREKEKLNNTLKEEIEKYLHKECSKIDDVEFHNIVKNSRSWHLEIRKILNHKIEIINLNSKKMTTTNTFDVRTATAVVQQYDGDSDGLQTFIDSAKLLQDMIPDEQQPMLVKFIKTRLTGKARSGLPENVNTLLALIDNVKQRCEDKTSSEQILAKLKTTKQKDNLDSFCDQIEILSNKLKNIYIRQQVPETVANTMVKKATVDALINGVSNNETKLILKAGSFDGIKDAIQRVQENDTIIQYANVFNFTTRGHYQRGWRRPSYRHRPTEQNSNNRQYGNYRPRIRGTGIRGGNFRNNFHRNESFSNSRGRYDRNNTGRMFCMTNNHMQNGNLVQLPDCIQQNYITENTGERTIQQSVPFLGQTNFPHIAQNQFSQ